MIRIVMPPPTLWPGQCSWYEKVRMDGKCSSYYRTVIDLHVDRCAGIIMLCQGFLLRCRCSTITDKAKPV